MLEILDIVIHSWMVAFKFKKVKGAQKKDKIRVELGLLEKNKKIKGFSMAITPNDIHNKDFQQIQGFDPEGSNDFLEEVKERN